VPTTHWHVRSAITGARVVIDVPKDIAEGEVDRLNEEARTGFRKPLTGAAGRLSDGTQDQGHRLVAENTGQALADDPDDPFRPEHVGRILHAGQPMEYELEREDRMTVEEIEEERKRLEAERTRG
jgi:hypothetical protein